MNSTQDRGKRSRGLCETFVSAQGRSEFMESPHVREVHTETVGAGVLDFDDVSSWELIHELSPLNSMDVFQRRMIRSSLASS